ncbi:MAG TPA: hypothetical protein PLL20_02345 [Phycisphaerae bacterium]|nr:hypothetical protein [Phycisphaerae bacterium]HRR84202.1 hypothetical protein [Phycisphaerae bacterium]
MGQDQAKTESCAAGDVAAQTSSNMQSDSKAAPPGDLTDVDLYCLHCGYNLRGLSGDPRRCPECGLFSPLSPSANMIARELGRMETWPTACVAAATLLVGSQACIVVALVNSRMPLGLCIGCWLPLLVLLPLWFTGMEQFRSDCLYKRGWKSVFVQYHIYGMALSILLASAAAASIWVFHRLVRQERSFIGAIGLVALAGIGLSVFLLARRARQQCNAKRHVLQREVATTRAKVQLYERLSRRRS